MRANQCIKNRPHQMENKRSGLINDAVNRGSMRPGSRDQVGSPLKNATGLCPSIDTPNPSRRALFSASPTASSR
jgi:hypothetical protein